MRAALQVGSTSPEVVAVEARRAAAAGTAQPAGEDLPAVLPLPHRPVPPAVTEPAVPRGLPSVQAYDELLTRRPDPTDTESPPSTQGEAVS